MKRKLLSLTLLITVCLIYSIGQGLACTDGNDSRAPLLIHSDTTDASTAFIDYGRGPGTPHLISPLGNVQHKIAQHRFGSSAIYFDGEGDYLSVSNSGSEWDLGGYDTMTVDFWYYPSDASCLSGNSSFCGRYVNENNNWSIQLFNGTNIKFVSVSSGSTISLSGPHGMTTGNWYHIAWVKDGYDYILFISGTSLVSISSTVQPYSQAESFWIGNGGTQKPIKGYIDEFRFSHAARWTNDFTPPTESFCNAESSQTSGKTAQDIIDDVRWTYLNDTSTSFWDDDSKLLNLVNRGILNIAALARCLETIEKITMETGVTEYPITSNYLSVEKAIYSGATTITNANPLKGLDRVDIRKLGHFADVGEPVRYYVWGDKVGIDPYPSSGVSGYSVYLYVAKRPTNIALSSCIPTPAIYDEALTLFVAAQALRKDKQEGRAKTLMAEYMKQVSGLREKYQSGVNSR